MILLLLVATGSCKKKNQGPEQSTPTSGEVSLIADESLRPVVDPMVKVFNSLYQFATVRCTYQPETEVLNALFKFQTPMVLTSRPLTQQEKDFFIAKKYFPRENIFALDAIALIVNPSVRDSLISVNQIRDILTGKISTWSQLGLSDSPDSIHVVFDHPGSGTLRFMKDSICRGLPFGPALRALKSNEEVIDFVAGNSRSMGVIGVSWISSSRDSLSLKHLKNLKVLQVSRTDPARPETSFPPYQSFIHSNSYPLIRLLYLINAEPYNGLATGFAGFVCSDRGQRIIIKTGIMPVYEPVRNVKIRD
jgi:phosphate transport system substrate-binding protein